MCINPAHLRWATRAENEQDKITHGRSNRGRSKALTGVRVRRIRKQYATGGFTPMTTPKQEDE